MSPEYPDGGGQLADHSVLWVTLQIVVTVSDYRYFTNNPIHKERTKHINIRYHFIRERVQLRELVIEKVDTKFNIADLFTKPVDNTTYSRLLLKLLGQ